MLIRKGQVSATARVKNSRRYVGRLLKTARGLFTFPMVLQPVVLNYICRGSPASSLTTMARKKHTVLLQLAHCWPHS